MVAPVAPVEQRRLAWRAQVAQVVLPVPAVTAARASTESVRLAVPVLTQAMVEQAVPVARLLRPVSRVSVVQVAIRQQVVSVVLAESQAMAAIPVRAATAVRAVLAVTPQEAATPMAVRAVTRAAVAPARQVAQATP